MNSKWFHWILLQRVVGPKACRFFLFAIHQKKIFFCVADYCITVWWNFLILTNGTFVYRTVHYSVHTVHTLKKCMRSFSENYCLWTLSWESVGSSLFSGGGCTRGRLLCQTCTWNEEAFKKSSFIYGFSRGYCLAFAVQPVDSISKWSLLRCSSTCTGYSY